MCKVFSAKPYGPATTAPPLPSLRTEDGRSYETTGIDYAEPITYKISKKEQGKINAMLIFTCGMSRAIRLKVTKSQRAEELKEKLNAFITRCTRPKCIVSDNGPVFRTTAAWIKKNRKSVMLQDYFARQQFTRQFNLSKSPRLGGLYKILIKDAKKTFYKTMGRTSFKYEEVNLW